ncbi:hypothetical protein F5X99DRAFT_284525 [Biscogniauxia marginata]|nr:hypothetical protein F5X99DRAFT_284525 [Biscogniauxia marginata]
MCIEVWTRFADCRHKQYQNTFPCHIARRCQPGDDMLLGEPVFLPARPPRMPPGLLDCHVRVATRPCAGTCAECRKNKLRPKQEGALHSSSSSDAALPPTETSSSTVSSSSRRVTSPSPDPQALERVRQSFIKITEEQRMVSGSSAGGRSRAGSSGSSKPEDRDQDQARPSR